MNENSVRIEMGIDTVDVLDILDLNLSTNEMTQSSRVSHSLKSFEIITDSEEGSSEGDYRPFKPDITVNTKVSDWSTDSDSDTDSSNIVRHSADGCNVFYRDRYYESHDENIERRETPGRSGHANRHSSSSMDYEGDDGRDIPMPPKDVYRWYFEESDWSESNQRKAKMILEITLIIFEHLLSSAKGCTKHTPVIMDGSTGRVVEFQWLLPSHGRDRNRYDVVIGLSMVNFDIGALQSITFCHEDETRDRRYEIITRSQLLDFAEGDKRGQCGSHGIEASPYEGFFKLKLHMKISLWSDWDIIQYGDIAGPTLSMEFKQSGNTLGITGHINLNFLELRADARKHYVQDGSQASVMDPTRTSFKYKSDSPPFVYKIYRDGAQGIPVSDFVEETFSKLQGYSGQGQFHIPTTRNHDIKDEVFVTYDYETIEVYNVYGQWSHIHSINLNQRRTDNDMLLSSCLRGAYLVLAKQDSNPVTTWSIKQGRLLSFIREATPYSDFTCLSRDGRLMVLVAFNSIDLYRTSTSTLLGSVHMQDITKGSWRHPCICGNRVHTNIRSVQFTRNDSQILINFDPCSAKMGEARALTFDVATFSVVDEFIFAGLGIVNPIDIWSEPPAVPTLSYWCPSSVNAVPMHDFIVNSFQIGVQCDHICKEIDQLQPIQTEVHSLSGLFLKASILDEDRFRITASVSSDPTSTTQTFDCCIGAILECGFLYNGSYLVTLTDCVSIIWTVPATLGDDIELISVQEEGRFLEMGVCSHGHLYVHEEDDKCATSLPLDEIAFRFSNSKSFYYGVLYLVEDYKSFDRDMKRRIVRYIRKYINSDPDPSGVSNSVLVHLCTTWTLQSYDSFVEFFKDLLASPSGCWIPRLDKDENSNPIWLLLEKAKTQPRALVLAEIIIEYCIRQARNQKDPYLLFPLMRCLPALFDPQRTHLELALKTLRAIAFIPIPVREQSFLTRKHVIAHPPELRWRFWMPITRQLFKCKDPVLHLSNRNSHNLENEYFIRELFVASFDMIWLHTTESLSKSSSTTQECSLPFSLTHVFFKTIWSKCTPFSKPTVVCHPFGSCIQALDNPTVAALIEYKWNTTGYYQWLFRFFWQFLFYVLVLAAIFVQVYGDHESTFEGLFISIAVASVLFLWLEVLSSLALTTSGSMLQSSIYNIMDLLAFLFPLAGSITQIGIIRGFISSGLNPGLLSFSVLFIFLHCLFELRVFTTVCQFVSIIIQTISSIRVFFFVFAGGILGFSISLLHLLQACIDNSCSNLSEDFPRHLLRSISATYFFMGGNYDSIGDEFRSDNVAFHVLIIIFFFFTVIIMINVLIALINHAFDDGDKIWRLEWIQHRMRYVESAENLTYDIPGLREKYHEWFPDLIYFSATPQQVRDYEKESRRLIDEAAPVSSPPKEPVTEDKDADMTSKEQGKEWIDQLRIDMKAEFNEELRQQLETHQQTTQELLIAQQEQSDNRIQQLEGHMKELLKLLKARS
ncbi:hypothetical protein BGZ50_005524 [Haplosporangium sp. Z 11]|nr:hypothetical protein BGZ50_005524 [Haplosporangium sp. Z 11]